MSNDNTVDNLVLNEGSRVSLNGDENNTNILTINRSLSGNGIFRFSTHTSDQVGNKILIKGAALGNYQFDVEDQGAEPYKSKRLTLLRVENGNLDNQLNVSLHNKDHVDLGTYRYHLMKDDQEFYLYSPVQAEYDAEMARLAEIEKKLLAANNTQADLISASANAAVSEFSSQINALLHINSYLDRKLTEKQSKEWYFWSRVENQKMHNHSDLYRSYQQNINLQQMGIEKQLSNNVAFGALYSLAQTKDLYADNIVGKRKIHQLSMYLKNIGLIISFPVLILVMLSPTTK
ncbi:autotransporter outer membrane beta-barrel domain-containing protein [Canicola haemoglobinophilus]|nr:autotransporter outer membrane beta-barrel domain-containing protein [Canicola haemoglobinophilus]